MNAIITKLDISKHKSYLLRILFDFSKDTILGRNLIFKGGTALLLFYNLDRFSTDLDFDLLDKDLDEKDILNRVGKILKKYGELKKLITKRHTIFGLISYGKIEHNIKIEINKRGVTGKSELKTLMGMDFNVMKLEDMCANKFLAVLGRNKLANRDIYDIYFIVSNNFEINKNIIEEKTGKSFKNYINDIIKLLKGLGHRYNILDGLGLVIEESRKQWIKDNLIKETIFLLGTYL